MSDVGLTPYLILGAFLFTCGVVCMASKRNAIGVLMGVELVLNGANVNFVAFARYNPALQIEGQVFALFTIVMSVSTFVTGWSLDHSAATPRTLAAILGGLLFLPGLLWLPLTLRQSSALSASSASSAAPGEHHAGH